MQSIAQSLSYRLGILLLILSLSVVISCDSFMDWEKDPDDVPQEEIIHLMRAGASEPLSANGQDMATLLALLPHHASSRTVTFTTTAGSFFGTARAKEFSVRAAPGTDEHKDRLIAEVVLVADTVATTAYVYAKVSEFSDSLSVTFLK